MGIGFLYILIIWIVLIIVFLVLLIYSLKKSKVLGFIISTFCLLILISFYFINDLDEFKFTKEKAMSDLKFLKISLEHDFKIVDNQVTGFPERFQETKLKISNNDLKRIVNQIKTADNFKKLLTSKAIENNIEEVESWKKAGAKNYEYPEFYSREVYLRVDNYPTKFLLYIEKKNNIISYQRIEE